jgi:conjugal transfer pilus assembly protein TraW
VDPSIQLSRNLTDARGRLLHRKGETVNPLHFITLHKRLIFFNGDDRDQVDWVAGHRRTGADPHQSRADTLILVRGDVPRQAKRWHQPVYFDQHGQWCRRLHLHQVPAVVQQQGDRLQVREVRP